MDFGSNNDNENIFKMLLQKSNTFNQSSLRSMGNTSFGVSPTAQQNIMGGMSGGIGGIQNLIGGGGGGGALGAIGSFADIGIGAATSSKGSAFDYTKDGYTVDDAVKAEGEAGYKSGSENLSKVPIVGGIVGGIMGMITKAMAEKQARISATEALNNKKSHMGELENYQMDKIKNNNFLKASDLYKNMFNQNNQLEV